METPIERTVRCSWRSSPGQNTQCGRGQPSGGIQRYSETSGGLSYCGGGGSGDARFPVMDGAMGSPYLGDSEVDSHHLII